eukprot:SAG11_NODE_146_length_14788_cov_5.672884_1_plen_238_part_10
MLVTEVFTRAKEFSPSLVEVDISNNSIGVYGASALGAVLGQTKIQKLIIGPQSTVIPVHDAEVTKLDVSNQNLGPAEIMLISSAIPTTPGLVGVDISRNHISADVASLLIESIQKSNINEVVIGPKSTLVPFNNSEVTSLDFSDQDLGPAEIMRISAAIPTTPGLVGVDISRDQISADVAPMLIKSIQKVNINEVFIGPKSTLVPFNNSEVTSLDFSDQDVGPAEIMPISAAIPTTPG